MSGLVTALERGTPSRESATRVAVVAALSATSMLFASVGSAYLVRRSFADWEQPPSSIWPFALLAFGLWASCGIEVASRTEGRNRRRGFRAAGLASGLYFLAALAVVVSIASGEGGLTAPHNAFIVLLLSVHLVHAILGAVFARWILRDATGDLSENTLFLVRLVTHFLTLILFAIVLLLFVRP